MSRFERNTCEEWAPRAHAHVFRPSSNSPGLHTKAVRIDNGGHARWRSIPLLAKEARSGAPGFRNVAFIYAGNDRSLLWAKFDYLPPTGSPRTSLMLSSHCFRFSPQYSTMPASHSREALPCSSNRSRSLRPRYAFASLMLRR